MKGDNTGIKKKKKSKDGKKSKPDRDEAKAPVVAGESSEKAKQSEDIVIPSGGHKYATLRLVLQSPVHVSSCWCTLCMIVTVCSQLLNVARPSFRLIPV